MVAIDPQKAAICAACDYTTYTRLALVNLHLYFINSKCLLAEILNVSNILKQNAQKAMHMPIDLLLNSALASFFTSHIKIARTAP